MNNIERNDLLTALYRTTEISELLNQFDSYLTVNAKGTNDKKKIVLLQQILFYSHAIIYNQKVQTATKWRGYFMTVAKNNKALKLSNKDVYECFSFLNNTTKSKIEKVTTQQPQKQQNKDSSAVSNSCIAKDELNRFKAQLDTKSYELKKGQATGDKEAFIKIVLVTLSTGATQKDILEDIDLSDYKPQLIELNIRTIKRYIKEIRWHYDYIERAKELKEKVKRNPKNEDFKKELRRVEPLAKKQANGEDVDVSTGIRKAIRGLGVQNATNTRGLIALYRECLTSSAPN